MAISKVYIELEWDGTYRRIVKKSEVWALDPAVVRQLPRTEAVTAIRLQVFKRANYCCEFCGANLTFKGGHMHEKNPRGNGGEISMDNSVALCYDCHLGRPDSEHGNRRFQSSKISQSVVD